MNYIDAITGDGKQKRCIIKLKPRYEEITTMFGLPERVEIEYDRLQVWCDVGYLKALRAVKGVMQVSQIENLPLYMVLVDPRYDTQWVVREVEAAIETNEPNTEEDDE